MRESPPAPPSPPRITGGVPVVPMEVAGRGQRLQMQEKLRILEDLNMLYIRQIAISLQDTEIQRKMERELRLREGACKLLAACSRREQALEAAKSLLVCNSRVLAYMAELQRRKEAQVLRRTARRPSDAGPTDERLPCRGTVCISDLRIPLMWKDTEYFRNKGELHRCAVFCLLQLGAEIHDTPMVLVDRTLTDICFESAVLFSEAGPDFELKVELYSAGLAGGSAQGSTPRKLATRLSTSLGRSSGKRVRAAMDGAPGSPPGNGGTSPLLLPAPNVPGPKFHLLAHAVLSLAEVQDGFRTHDLAITSNEESSFWLPLYGSMCCRLAAQPRCMAAPVTSGFLRLQPGAEAQSGTRLYCVLRGTDLLCYQDPSEAEAGLEPALTIAINKETRIRAAEREGRGQPHGMAVTNRYGGEEVTHTLLAESRAEAQRWMEAFWQHFYDMSQWKQCCDELMRIEVPPPRRPAAMLPRQGSLYHEMAIDPADDIEAVTDILTQRAGGRVPGTPPWLSLFEGPPMHTPRSGRACSPSPPTRRPWGRPRTLSLDAKLSTLKGRGSRRAAPSPRPLPPSSSPSSSGSSSPATEHDPPSPLQSQV
uniref:Rhotekin n=1 Tax=Calidris pygmaea TaxID=425635 RepID=A0A8C3KDW8_9CHAR